ncbi:MAG: hypothetical protein PHW10_05895 [Candidatus Peribacteraceae bacterium]|nr:hypothetical protein [Candidatus Peribacteraceae bacterium]
MKSKAEDLIAHIRMFDAAGALPDAAVDRMRSDLDATTEETRHHVRNALHSPVFEWEKYGVSEGFYHSIKPEEWNIFIIYAQNRSRMLSVVEVAETLFQTSQPTSEQIRQVKTISMHIRIRAKNDPALGKLNIGMMKYRGTTSMGFQWFPATDAV